MRLPSLGQLAFGLTTAIVIESRQLRIEDQVKVCQGQTHVVAHSPARE